MTLQLIHGTFAKEEALEILTKMLHVKIQFHEGKIEKSHNEEDIKMRELRIKQLQQQFYEAKQAIISRPKNCEIESIIQIK